MAGQGPIRVPRGTVDLAGEELHRVEAVERTAREVFARFGFEELRGPLFEETRLFARAIGEDTDVVEKEMFTIPREKESYSLRPEGTASVVRFYVERALHASAPFQKICYAGPMFRYERPQAGRQRQFHQVGIEVLGSESPYVDAEVVLVQDRFFRALGVEGQEVKLNTIGGREERDEVRGRILALVRPRAADLCDRCRERMGRNVFRVLDCKRPSCRAAVADLPPLVELVGAESRARFREVQAVLGDAGVTCREDPFLVRGLDYYTHTVFETVHPALGARDAICGGGRYDGLVEELGGPATPACGFAVGVEATLLALEKLGREPPVRDLAPHFQVVVVDDASRAEAFRLLTELRDAGLCGDMDHEGRSLRSQMKRAGRGRARYALIIGPGEIERGVVTLRSMEDGEQEEVVRGGVAARIAGEETD